MSKRNSPVKASSSKKSPRRKDVSSPSSAGRVRRERSWARGLEVLSYDGESWQEPEEIDHCSEDAALTPGREAESASSLFSAPPSASSSSAPPPSASPDLAACVDTSSGGRPRCGDPGNPAAATPPTTPPQEEKKKKKKKQKKKKKKKITDSRSPPATPVLEAESTAASSSAPPPSASSDLAGRVDISSGDQTLPADPANPAAPTPPTTQPKDGASSAPSSTATRRHRGTTMTLGQFHQMETETQKKVIEKGKKDSDCSVRDSLSFATAAKENRESVPNLHLRLRDFLTKFHSSERGASHLQIKFDDLLKHDKELAYEICFSRIRDRYNEWVFPTVFNFLHGETSVEGKRDPATFDGMPDSVKRAADFLREKQPLTSIKRIVLGMETMKLVVASDHGLELFRSAFAHVFDRQMEGWCWKGDFGIDDIWIINSKECWITKKPKSCVDPRDRIKDFQHIAEIFMPYFKSVTSEMPLFFDALKEDLDETTVHHVKEEWFKEYMLSHVAFKPSMARFDLVQGLHRSADNFRGSEEIRSALAAVHGLQDWKDIIPNDEENFMYKVYWFKFKVTEDAQDPYESTTRDLLKYMRNFGEHAKKHDKNLMIEDDTDFEQYLAKKFPYALPRILKKLLERRIHKNKPLARRWTIYSDSIF